VARRIGYPADLPAPITNGEDVQPAIRGRSSSMNPKLLPVISSTTAKAGAAQILSRCRCSAPLEDASDALPGPCF